MLSVLPVGSVRNGEILDMLSKVGPVRFPDSMDMEI